MRQGDWKLIEFFEEGAAELYDLAEDISEKQNLASVAPDRLRAMRTTLAAWRAETGAFFPTPQDPGTGVAPAAKKPRRKRPK